MNSMQKTTKRRATAMNHTRRRGSSFAVGVEGHAIWFELDERLAYARDIIHEIRRDGAVRGSFGSDPS